MRGGVAFIQYYTTKIGIFLMKIIIGIFFSLLIESAVYAGKPLWTFVAQTATQISITKASSAQIIYTIQNHTVNPKVLVMKPVNGVIQTSSCKLAPKGQCILTLNINGSALQGDVLGGPILCQQGNDLQCYQPSVDNSLRIQLTQQPIAQFTITPSANLNGSISPATAQTVNAGSSLSFTAIANPGFGVNQWLVDGNVVQTGGLSFQLTNIQANHSVEVTFGQTTLSPSTQNLALSITSSLPTSDPALIGNARVIQISNTGSVAATNLQITLPNALPNGTTVDHSSCTSTLSAGSTCDITITPGSNASQDMANSPCTASPGSRPLASIVRVTADNAPSTDINVLVLGYGCIYQGGYVFAIDDTTSITNSIAGKVAALTEQSAGMVWGPNNVAVNGISQTSTAGINSCDGKNNGACNSSRIIAANLQAPVAALLCENLISEGFNDWFMPAICEVGRYVGMSLDAGCGTNDPNLYITLYTKTLGGFGNNFYWSSTEVNASPASSAWIQSFSMGAQGNANKSLSLPFVRCIRAF